MIKNYLRFLKGASLLAFFLVFLNVNANAQETHRISNAEENSLKIFIEDLTKWAPGDIIELESAGDYIVHDGIEIKQDITIRGAEGLAQRPRVVMHRGAFMPRAENLTIVLENFNMNGLTKDSEGNVQRASILQYGRRSQGGEFGNSTIRIEDMDATGFDYGVELFYDKGLRYKSLTINNVNWSDINYWVIEPRINATDRIEVTNSTFWNIGGFLKNPYFVDEDEGRTDAIPQVIVIDHNTFYNVATSIVPGSDVFLQINDPKDGQVNFTFTNNIVSTLGNTVTSRPIRLDPAAGTFTFRNNLFHDMDSPREGGRYNLASVASAQENVTVEEPVTGKPVFANPAAGKFALATGSPLLTAGSEGGALGDPSWATEEAAYAIHRISNAEENTLKTFIEDITRWAPGDIIELESAGDYMVRDGIEIKQDITIRGAEGLAQRPRIVMYGGALMPRANDLDILLEDFDMNGLTTDNAGAEQRAAIIQYGADGEFGNSTIRIEDMNASGFLTGVELFYNSGLHYKYLTIKNVNWNDISGWVIDPRINATDRIEVTNSTFWNIGGFLKNPYNVDPTKERSAVYPMVIFIDHNTFYNVASSGVSGADVFLQLNDPKEGQVDFTFSNNIVSTLGDQTTSRPFRINPEAGTFRFNNNLFHSFNSAREGGIYNLEAVAAAQSNVTVTNPVPGNPTFANPQEGNFTLPADYGYLTAGTNGTIMGDPRWHPGNVTSTDPELTAAKIEVYPNPVRDVLHINSPGAVEVTIYNISGSVVMTSKIDRVGSINIASLKSGLYIARINSGSNVQSVKVIKE